MMKREREKKVEKEKAKRRGSSTNNETSVKDGEDCLSVWRDWELWLDFSFLWLLRWLIEISAYRPQTQLTDYKKLVTEPPDLSLSFSSIKKVWLWDTLYFESCVSVRHNAAWKKIRNFCFYFIVYIFLVTYLFLFLFFTRPWKNMYWGRYWWSRAISFSN